MSGAADVTLFGHWICPFSVRVEWTLAQRDIAYDVIDVPPSAVRPRDFVVPEEFVRHSPRLEVPMVRIGDEHLADSIPILWWLEREFPERSLVPPGHVDLVRERVEWIDRHVYRPMVGVYYGTEPDRIAESSRALAEALAGVASWLDDGGWCVGTEPSLCEALMVPLYVRLDGLRRLGFTHDVPAAVLDHLARCTTTVGWRAAAWSPAQVDEFVGRFEKYRRLRGA